MNAFSVIKRLDEFKYSRTSFVFRTKSVFWNKLLFESSKKAFGYSIVPAVTFATHASNHLPFCQQAPIVSTGILKTLIGVNGYSRRRISFPDGHLQRVCYQFKRHSLFHRPINDLARIEVDKDTKIDPALSGPKIRHVADPRFVWSIFGEISLQQIRKVRLEMSQVRGKFSKYSKYRDGSYFSLRGINDAESHLNSGFECER